MFKVGVTGGIGSGKSTICKVFQKLGAPVYYADQEAKELMVSNSNIVREIKNVFGEESYVDEKYNSAYISSVVFKDESKLETLNKIVHPEVARHFSDWINKQNFPYIIKEAAILFETGSYKSMDYNILVVTEEEERIRRVMDGDDISKEEVVSRISKQWNDKQKSKFADYILKNDQEPILNEILNLHKDFLIK